MATHGEGKGNHRKGREGLAAVAKPAHAPWWKPFRLLVFLACLTVVLEHQHFFQGLDATALTVIGQLQPEDDTRKLDEPHEVVAVSASTKLFEAPIFGAKLPVDRDGLAAMLVTLLPDKPAQAASASASAAAEQPRVIAIDVDITPLSRATAEDLQLQAAPPPIHAAILKALAAGIDIVAATYPNQSDANRAERTRDWRAALCARVALQQKTAQQDHRPDKPRIGRLRFASPLLVARGTRQAVVDYERPALTAQQPCDETARGLGLVAADLARERPEKPAPEPGCCSPHDSRFINFFSRKNSMLEVDSIEQLAAFRPLLGGRVVILGVKSFAGVDEHLTPFGRMPGSAVHAAIAQTEFEDLKSGHREAFGLDLALGLLFIGLAFLLHMLVDWATPRLGHGSSLLYLIRLAGPLFLFALLGGATLLFAQRLAYAGIWLNPLGMLLGLSLHLYEHLANTATAHDTELRGGPLLRGTERALRCIGYLILADVILWAGCILLAAAPHS